MRDRSRTEDLGDRRLMGMDMGASITANISEHRGRHQERADDDHDAIYEMPDEDEHASSPPCSLSN